MSHYKPYPAYRDSEVEWIGEVPEHWTIQPVKQVFSTRLGKMISPKPSSEDDLLVPYHRAQTVQWEKIEHEQVEKMWASGKEIASFGVRKGDLLICEGGDVCRAAICDIEPVEPTIIQNSIHRVRSKGFIKVEWLLHLMQLVRSSEWIDVLCNKNTIVHFTSEKLDNLRIPVPSGQEHGEILEHLNRETARIDALIAKKTRFIELLKEKRQAIITHAVTKGLDPNVKLKDSGIEWLGKVPAHWHVRPIKNLATGSGTLFIDGDWIESKNLSDAGIRYITTGNIGEGKYKEQGSGFISESTFYELRCTEVLPGDILISRLNPPIGRACIAPDLGCRVVTSVDNVILRPGSEFDSTFIVSRFSAGDYFHEMSLLASGATMQRVSRTELGNVRIAWPPLKEQVDISRHIQTETFQIDTLLDRVSTSIDLLKERRSAFITAAVTGKIDLRESI